MATIQEDKVTPEWVDDLYQIEMTDPVTGGSDGVANRQAKQLGQRTQWLKKAYEEQDEKFERYKKSVSSASETAAGVTKLTDNIEAHKDDDDFAVSPKGVVDYLDSQSVLLNSIDELRKYSGDGYVTVRGYYDNTPGVGGGLFFASPTDTTSADNGGTVVVSSNGTRWIRAASLRNLDVKDFGGELSSDSLRSVLSSNYINLPSFKTRQDFIDRQQELLWVPNGHVIVAQGLMYCRNTESQLIPDLKGWMPVNESFGHYDNDYTPSENKSSLATKYIKTAELTYNKTWLRNPKPGSIRKYYTGGIDKTTKEAKLTTLRAEAKSKEYPCVLMNADLFLATSNLDENKTTVQGLQIIDGEIFKNFDYSDNRDALVMLRNGWLSSVKKSDGLTDQQLKGKGVVWSAYFGPTLIKDGAIQPGLNNVDLSSRNIIGQLPNRDIVIIQVEGVTGSSGCTMQRAAELLQAEGCIFGFNLDGGGSSQTWWKNCYSFLSSDKDFSSERKVGGILELTADVIDDFDTGWQAVSTVDGIVSADAAESVPAVCFRQIGAEVNLRISIQGEFNAGFSGVITKEKIPARFESFNKREMRGAIVGADLTYGYWYSGAFLSLRAIEKSPYFTGLYRWNVRNSIDY